MSFIVSHIFPFLICWNSIFFFFYLFAQILLFVDACVSLVQCICEIPARLRQSEVFSSVFWSVGEVRHEVVPRFSDAPWKCCCPDPLPLSPPKRNFSEITFIYSIICVSC